MDFFGYNISKVKPEKKSVADKVKQEDFSGASNLAGSNYFGISFEGTYSDQEDLINIYRNMAIDGYVSGSIDEIINEAIVTSFDEDIVTINLEKTEFSDNIKKSIETEFLTITNLLNFNSNGADIFRKWFVDGIMYVFKNVEKKSNSDGLLITNKGIKKAEILDPRKTKYIEDVDKNTGKTEKYFLYTANKDSNEAIKLSVDTVTMITSGLYDSDNAVISNLHQVIKPYNQLVSLEDAVVVYRMVRAPERRIFFIDIGELPKTQAEEYMKDIINKNNNNSVYDAKTGKMKENTNMRSMLEDIYLPRRDGNRSTEVTTLASGQNLGEMSDVEYFKKRLYSALKIPVTRSDSENLYNIGSNNEITRAEIKFFKYITKLRNRFNDLFFDLLKTQLIIKKIITLDEWNKNANLIRFVYNNDSHFTEMKESELMSVRLNNLSTAHDYLGIYFSKDYIQKTILRRTEEQIKETEKQIKDEGSKPAE